MRECPVCGDRYEYFHDCKLRRQIEELPKEMERIAEEDRRHREELEEERRLREEDRHWEEEGQRQSAAIQAQKREIEAEERQVEAEERQKENLANAWRFEAQKKTDQAFELYKAGLLDDALRLLQSAIEQDPSNIDPFLYTAWALEAKGETLEAAEYYRKQIALLRTAAYNSSPIVHERVLNGLPAKGEDLVRALATVSRENAPRWTQSLTSINLVNQFRKRGLLDDAEHLATALLPRWAQSSDAVSALNRLLKLGLLDHAEKLASALVRKGDSLLLQAYLLEIDGLRSSAPREQPLRAFLATVLAPDRSRALRDFQAALHGDYQFTGTTIGLLKKCLSERHEQWLRETEAEILRSANVAALSKLGGEPSPGRTGCQTAILFYLASLFYVGYISMLATTSDRSVFFGYSVLIIIVTGWCAGWVARNVARRRALERIVRQHVHDAQVRDLDEWHDVLENRTAVEPPKRSIQASITAHEPAAAAFWRVVAYLGLAGGLAGLAALYVAASAKTPTPVGRVAELGGKWIGRVSGTDARLEILHPRSAPTKLLAILETGGFWETLSVETRPSGMLVLRTTGYRRLIGRARFCSKTLLGQVSSARNDITGTYTDACGRSGQWSITRVSAMTGAGVRRPSKASDSAATPTVGAAPHATSRDSTPIPGPQAEGSGEGKKSVERSSVAYQPSGALPDSAVPGVPPGAKGGDRLEWAGVTRDEVGRGPRSRGADGQADAMFRLVLVRSDRVISRIVLRRPNTRQIWRSYENPYGNWVLGVLVNGRRVQPDRNGDLLIPLSEVDELSLFASDDWVRSHWFDGGQRYEVEINYVGVLRPDTLRLVIP